LESLLSIELGPVSLLSYIRVRRFQPLWAFTFPRQRRALPPTTYKPIILKRL